MSDRPTSYRFHNGEKAPLPFAPEEYETRLAGLRAILAERGLDACLLTSMHNVAYYSGFLYCSFGRPYGLVVTPERAVTIGAGQYEIHTVNEYVDLPEFVKGCRLAVALATLD